jgi:hypothetical protein
MPAASTLFGMKTAVRSSLAREAEIRLLIERHGHPSRAVSDEDFIPLDLKQISW